MTTDSKAAAPAGLTIVRDAACTGCGCLCDDIDLSVDGGRIVAAERACELGLAWFLDERPEDRPVCLVDGQVATVDAGIERAAEILITAKYPLIYGLSETTCEAQRLAVAIADWIGGNVDTTTGFCHGPAGVTFQGVGEVTCSLGEIANRGDLILFWGSNPAESHPRHFARYSLEPKGMFVPRGRADRTCVVVDIEKTASANEADIFITITPGRDFEALWTLRSLAQGLELDAQQIERETGVPLSVWQDLMVGMKQAKFGVILYGTGLTMTAGKHINGEAVLALVRDMNAFTRFVALPMHERGNTIGADNVMSWQTGYPFGVNLSRGYPRFNPGEYTADDALARGEVDAVMIVGGGSLSSFSPAAHERLASIPTITIDRQHSPLSRGAAVAITTATYGIHTPGTVYRMDDVPIPLRPALESPYPSDRQVLELLEVRVRQLIAAGSE